MSNRRRPRARRAWSARRPQESKEAARPRAAVPPMNAPTATLDPGANRRHLTARQTATTPPRSENQLGGIFSLVKRGSYDAARRASNRHQNGHQTGDGPTRPVIRMYILAREFSGSSSSTLVHCSVAAVMSPCAKSVAPSCNRAGTKFGRDATAASKMRARARQVSAESRSNGPELRPQIGEVGAHLDRLLVLSDRFVRNAGTSTYACASSACMLAIFPAREWLDAVSPPSKDAPAASCRSRARLRTFRGRCT